MNIKRAENSRQIEAIRLLYEEAFPDNERKPFALMLEKCKEGAMELLCIEDEKQDFWGLAIFVLYKDMVLLDYFAIDNEKRGLGIGTKALKLLQNYYKGKRFYLEIEDVHVEADNTQERIRRRAFYLRNDMMVMPFTVDLFGVIMEVLTYQCVITDSEYMEVYTEVFGKERIQANVKIISAGTKQD